MKRKNNDPIINETNIENKMKFKENVEEIPSKNKILSDRVEKLKNR